MSDRSSRYVITRFDCIILSYGAICGFVLLLYAFGNPVLALIIGVPPGILGAGLPMLIHKRFTRGHDAFAVLPKQEQWRIVRNVVLILTVMLGYHAFSADWFAFGCIVLLAGTFLLFFAYEFGLIPTIHKPENDNSA